MFDIGGISNRRPWGVAGCFRVLELPSGGGHCASLSRPVGVITDRVWCVSTEVRRSASAALIAYTKASIGVACTTQIRKYHEIGVRSQLVCLACESEVAAIVVSIQEVWFALPDRANVPYAWHGSSKYPIATKKLKTSA